MTTTHSFSLDATLLTAEFGEHHERVIAAEPDSVWRALHGVTLADLRLTRTLVAVRYLGRAEDPDVPLLESGPVPPLYADRPRRIIGGRVSKPWQRRPGDGPRISDLTQLREFAEPGWLKLGTEFVLTPLPGDRTRLVTTTLCEPTDDDARRRFAAYWRLIRPFSGVVRRDLLAGVDRLARRVPD